MEKERLCKVLCKYIKDTFDIIDRVRDFCGKFPKWMDRRQSELEKIKKCKMNADSRYTELSDVLKNTLIDLKELDHFLDAVEKLAVTSEHVFTENEVLNLPDDVNLAHVQAVIIAAQLICPLLLEFKRDANVFFLPKLQNADIMAYQLERYIQVTKNICEGLEKSCIRDLSPMVQKEVPVYLDLDLPFNDIQKMLHHVDQLEEVRNNEDFRMLFLFQNVSCSHFISEFSKRQPKMLQLLNELEKCAVQLDQMNKGAKISSVAGSSVGVVGSVLSIVGLALIPFTAGVSLGLTIGGTATGMTSGVNSIVTTFTKIGVNRKYKKKANEIFNSFMSEVKSLQKCLNQVTGQPVTNLEKSCAIAVALSVRNVVPVGAAIYSLSKDVSDAKLIANKDVIVHGGKVVVKQQKALGHVSRAASDVAIETSEAGEVALKGTLTLSKALRYTFIAANAAFIVMDICSICINSISLAKGSKTEVSQFIRARAALWKSEVDSWKKMHDSLCLSQSSESEKRKAVLERPFYIK